MPKNQEISKILAWKVKESSKVIADEWLTVRSESCETGTGVLIEPYYVLEYPDWAHIAVINDNQELLIVWQYRHAERRVCPEFPAGRVDRSDPSPRITMERELLEETGYRVKELRLLGNLTPNAATHANSVFAFLGLNPEKIAEPTPDESEDITAEWVSIERLMQLIDFGEFRSVLYISTLFLALRELALLSAVPVSSRD